MIEKHPPLKIIKIITFILGAIGIICAIVMIYLYQVPSEEEDWYNEYLGWGHTATWSKERIDLAHLMFWISTISLLTTMVLVHYISIKDVVNGEG